ncbi:MAG: bifunctional UDP-3-O-[3-hydroxymyristoyl] N-acetylglucosamine deacetylase/3-hydroxyacyl-ACP dehydratase [Bacteroidales bacterium]|nr:bifunctional UDP-3-O-[3-hydroxymyristoyl] N-acetylglucosamine deacetylase/3-hydroxyacyl-ACP dehydratase [Bacteroidales bacterium]MDD3664855.1 bifunctional UDP-3-O-[3-hydroxymyristoyl] N-acetylglucosamine deacetylase/3-hydroxyacyl-ACP dehydratase [Bacteroidales bacterium]
MSEKQRTIREVVSISGTGLHTGQHVTVTFRPAPENHGYKFVRTDLEGSPVIEADIDYVKDTERGTNLVKNDVRISTTEHLLAAVFGLGIDNLIIETTGVELPILDGSSRFWVETLDKAGIVEQNAEREYYELTQNIVFRNQDKKVEIIAIPSPELRYSVMIDYESKVLDTQHAALDHIDDFRNEIANSRTFVFLHEMEYLISNNLIKGGDLNNAIVFVNRLIGQDELDRLSAFFNKPRVEVLKEGILNNIELNQINEPARHKLLDVIGDLSLLGVRIRGHIIATRPGHASNIAFAKMIREQIRNEKKMAGIPQYDPNKPPLFDINAIKRLLPHRPPFLLVDKILDMDAEHVIGIKNVTMNETFFNGHFPDEPVMPGVLQIEAMAQTGGILILSSVPDPENYLTFFMKIDNVRFRQKVVPGDTLIFSLKLLSPIRRGLCHMAGQAFVGDKVVMEAEMLAQIARKPAEVAK